MNIEGMHRISAPRAAVWQAMNDPAVLQACIPGCEAVTAASPTEMAAVVVVKVGPIKARFTGQVTLTEIDAPQRYVIVGAGQGGIAGHAKGRADVRLIEEAGETVLTYAVTSEVGGKIAQLGARLIEGTARRLAGEFFARLAAGLEFAAEPQPDKARSFLG